MSYSYVVKIVMCFSTWNVWADQKDKHKRHKPPHGHYLDKINISMWDWFLLCDYYKLSYVSYC